MLVATRVLCRISLGQSVKGITQLRHISLTSKSPFQHTLLRLARKNVIVPQLAESLSEGDIRFEKNIGDIVTEDDQLASIETDKTSVPVNSPVAGKIVELCVEDSSTVKPGEIIMVIDTDGKTDAPSKTKTATPATQTSAPTHKEEASTPASTPQPSPPSPPSPPPPVTKPKSVSIDTVKTELKTLPGQFNNDLSQTRTTHAVKMNRMRQKIASRLKEAQNTYAMLTTFNEIDMSNLIEMRLKYKDVFLKKHNVKLGFMSAFVKASAYALKDQPVVNAVIEENQIIYRDFVDISVAVATPKGLVVPVLRNVDYMNFADIEKAINQLGEKAKTNCLSVSDMEGGSFTISNGGVFGSLFGTPIINPPQSAILGMHAINDKPAAVNGQVVIRPIMVVALTYDHRLIDGREAVTFLKKIKEVIEDPRIILLDL